MRCAVKTWIREGAMEGGRGEEREERERGDKEEKGRGKKKVQI